MTCPFRTDLLKLVPPNVQIVQFGALETGPLNELIIGDVEPLKVGECVFLREDSHALNPIVGQIQPSQSHERVQRAHIDQAVIGKIDSSNVLDLLGNLHQLLALLACAVDVGELKALFVCRIVKVGQVGADVTRLEHEFGPAGFVSCLRHYDLLFNGKGWFCYELLSIATRLEYLINLFIYF